MSGTVGAVVTLAVVLTLGVLAFAALGPQAVEIGIPAAFATVVVGALVYALAGRSALPAGGPSSTTALILAGLVSILVADPALGLPSVQGVRLVLAATGAAVVLGGVLIMVMAGIGLARLSRFVPQPVLSGFMNGVALLVVASQVPALLGVAPAALREGVVSVAGAFAPGALVLGLATAGCVWLVAWRAPRVPAALAGLAFGLGAYALGRWLLPGLPLGAPLGPMPDGSLWPDALLPLLGPDGFDFMRRHVLSVLLFGGLLALIGTLESMLSLQAFDQRMGESHNPQRELGALGLANIATGLCGGLPCVMLRARATATLQAGGRGVRPCIVASVAFALVFLVGRPLLEPMPMAVLAGIMLTVAVALSDPWSHRLLRRALAGESSRSTRTSLAIMLVVCLATVWQGVAAGVVLGVLLATAVFVHGMNRSLVRQRFDGHSRPSRRIWPPATEARLQPARQHIVGLELEGALFFGNAERVFEEAGTLPADCRVLVIDLRRVSTIDETGALMLQKLDVDLARRGVTLIVAGVTADNPIGQQLAAYAARGGLVAAWTRDSDRALEQAERLLLGTAELHEVPVPLPRSNLFAGLTPEQSAMLAAAMPARRLAAGEWVFREGEPADGLYVPTEGSISVVSAQGDQRFLSFSPGVMFGELAMLDGGGRTAGARADTDAEVHCLAQHALQALSKTDPELHAQIYRNIAAHLSVRLRQASMAWRAAAQ